jgi:hypothetical protein
VELHNKVLSLPNSKKEKGYYLPILERIDGQLAAMLSHHSKVLVIRLDLHVLDNPDTNEQVSAFIRRLRKWTDQKGHKRLGYVWCREQHKSDKPHYHLVIILNGNITCHPHNVIKAVMRYWKDWDIGTVYTPKHCYYLVKRDDQKAYDAVIWRTSYLAKVHSKDKSNPATNDYSTSRIKLKS